MGTLLYGGIRTLVGGAIAIVRKRHGTILAVAVRKPRASAEGHLLAQNREPAVDAVLSQKSVL